MTILYAVFLVQRINTSQLIAREDTLTAIFDDKDLLKVQMEQYRKEGNEAEFEIREFVLNEF